MNKDEIIILVDEKIKKAMAYSTVKYGDTPTDALQLVPKKYADSLSSGFVGQVNSGGTTGTLPTGWTVTHPGTGSYIVTHNLGVYNRAIVNSIGVVGFQNVVANDLNSFQVSTYNSSAAGTDTAWQFIVMV